MLASSVAYGQSTLDGKTPYDGITSYIFSPMAITVILVLALIAQIAYWNYGRNAARKPQVAATVQPVQAAKRRYDRDSMSKLLKASASSKGNARSLEEAIRLSQLTQPVLPERAKNLHVDDVESVDLETEIIPEDENQPTMVPKVGVAAEVLKDVSVVELEPDSDHDED
jgi:Tfp pilus assembly protein PilE